jgi:hypothetical protein
MPGCSTDWHPTTPTLRPVTVVFPPSWYGWSVPNALYTKLEEARQGNHLSRVVLGSCPQSRQADGEVRGRTCETAGTHSGSPSAVGSCQVSVVFQHPPMPNSSTGTDSSRLQEAIVDFTPDQIRDMCIHELRKSCVGVIIERELHELLEFAQLRTNPGVPLFNPHHYTEDLVDIVEKVANSLLKHTDVGRDTSSLSHSRRYTGASIRRL